MLKRLLILPITLALLTSTAFAAELQDYEYTSKYFGTIVTFKVEKLVQLPQGGMWWDKLPSDLQDPTYIATKVNVVRQRVDRTDLVSPDDILFQLPYDDEGAQRGSYSFSYAELTPSEVKLLLSGFDNLKSLFPGAVITYTPLMDRTFDVSSESLDSPLVFNKVGVQFSLPPGSNALAMRELVLSAFKAHFGPELRVGYLSYSELAAEDGMTARSISFSAGIGQAQQATGD